MGTKWKLYLTLRILEFTSHQIYHGACKPTNVQTRQKSRSDFSLTVGPRNPELFSKLYKGLVRPILEYCYLVWPPHLKKDSAILDKEQRRACRFTLRNIGRDTSCEEGFKFLKWPTLHQRRLFSSLTECYKTVHSLKGLHPFEYFTLAHDFQPLRANYRHKLKPLPTRLNSFKYSFFVNIVN